MKCVLIAEAKGGHCLSTDYINARTPLQWQCAEGHIWQARSDNIKHGQWCPECRVKTVLTLDDMNKLAEAKYGKCLSSAYVNNLTKLEWKCAKGHTWKATPTDIKRGNWCPRCAGVAKLSIKDMQEAAKAKGGRCLSSAYTNVNTKLEWECSRGHTWYAVPSSINQGHWCPYCSGITKLTVEDMQRIAFSRGGKYLSLTYVNAQTKAEWECSEGHKWFAIPNSIKRGRWCPICAKEKRRRKTS